MAFKGQAFLGDIVCIVCDDILDRTDGDEDGGAYCCDECGGEMCAGCVADLCPACEEARIEAEDEEDLARATEDL